METPKALVFVMSFIGLLACLYILAVCSALPVSEPDISNCKPIFTGPNTSTDCCIPNSSTIIDFRSPQYATLRVRPAAHLLDDIYIQKYKNATNIMRKLDPNHPWSLAQQANIHCSYCNAFYNQTGYNVSFQVHFNWLFYPFHRAYLYFFERILGKLIGDDTFALPFWNWDNPDGMAMPSVYTDPASPLYDVTRNPLHQPPNIVDLGIDVNGNGNIGRDRSVELNLRTMHQQMVREGITAELFIGGPYRAGDDGSSSNGGSLENGAHVYVHGWTGRDMGTFTTAGKDPIFYAHHANVDRMWELWKELPDGNRTNYNDTDWLDSSFLFWDENMQLVRIKVGDMLDSRNLGYVYQSVPVPWANKTYKPDVIRKPTAKMFNSTHYPVILHSPVSLEVMRPDPISITDGIVEVLVVEEIEFEVSDLAKFDVYVSAKFSMPEASQLAGSFTHLATNTRRINGEAAKTKTRLKFGLTELLRDIGASDDKSIIVTLVPRTANVNITVGNIMVGFCT